MKNKQRNCERDGEEHERGQTARSNHTIFARTLFNYLIVRRQSRLRRRSNLKLVKFTKRLKEILYIYVETKKRLKILDNKKKTEEFPRYARKGTMRRANGYNNNSNNSNL